jgi:hypothetical protein
MPTLGHVLVHQSHIVQGEVERPADVEGHLAVETETPKAEGVISLPFLSKVI